MEYKEINDINTLSFNNNELLISGTDEDAQEYIRNYNSR